MPCVSATASASSASGRSDGQRIRIRAVDSPQPPGAGSLALQIRQTPGVPVAYALVCSSPPFGYREVSGMAGLLLSGRTLSRVVVFID